MKIWILDNENTILEELQKTVSNLLPNNEISVFLEASEASAMLNTSIPDIVISNIHMDFIQRLRILSGYRIMVILTNCNPNEKVNFQVEEYLGKSFDMSAIEKSLNRCVKKVISLKKNINNSVSCLYSALLSSTAQMEPIEFIDANRYQLQKAYFSLIAQGLFCSLPLILLPLISYEPLETEKQKYLHIIERCYKDTYDFAIPYCDNIPSFKPSDSLSLPELKARFSELVESFFSVGKITGYSRKCLICDVAMEIVDANLLKASLEKVSDMMGISPTFLSSVYSEVNQSSFKQYIVDSRIRKACDFLKNTTMEIRNIVTAVGYSDIKYFRFIFRKTIGMSPAEYRSKVRVR